MAAARKPLFTKPAWASKSTSTTSVRPLDLEGAFTDSDSDVGDTTHASIFGQKHIYHDIVAQERQRREKHAQRAQDRKQKPEHQKKDDDTQRTLKVGNAKRRRISEDPADEEEESGDEDTDNKEAISAASSKKMSRSALSKSQGQQATGSLRSPATRRSRRHARDAGTDVISLDDGEDGDEKQNVDALSPEADFVLHSSESKRATSDRNAKQPQVEPDPESDEEDEYLRDLKRRAREEARLKKLGVMLNNAPVSTNDGQAAPLGERVMSPEAAVTLADDDTLTTGNDASGPVQDDPEILIYIETIIPNAKKLVVNRRASQPLDKVKEFWCLRNGLPPIIASKVFLTWNGTRLYNSSTARGIIEILKKTHPMRDGSDPSKGKIMLEAMTEEIFEHRQQQRERRRKEAEARARGEHLASEGEPSSKNVDDSRKESEKVKEVERPGLIIRLLCPGVEDMNMRIKSNTAVSRIITAFRHQRDIEPSKQCWLSYDGDRLENEQTAEEIGLEHEDTLDVYLR